MVEYRLLTIWRVEAPLKVVYAAIHDSPRWPDWWPGVKQVELVATGDADGINSVLRYCPHGPLLYRMTFVVYSIPHGNTPVDAYRRELVENS